MYKTIMYPKPFRSLGLRLRGGSLVLALHMGLGFRVLGFRVWGLGQTQQVQALVGAAMPSFVRIVREF